MDEAIPLDRYFETKLTKLSRSKAQLEYYVEELKYVTWLMFSESETRQVVRGCGKSRHWQEIRTQSGHLTAGPLLPGHYSGMVTQEYGPFRFWFHLSILLRSYCSTCHFQNLRNIQGHCCSVKELQDLVFTNWCQILLLSATFNSEKWNENDCICDLTCRSLVGR